MDGTPTISFSSIGSSNAINGVSNGILESISKFTNAFASPAPNENDNGEEEEDELNVKEPISSNSSPILTEPFFPGNAKSMSFEPNHSSIFFNPDASNSIIEDKIIQDHSKKEVEVTLTRLIKAIEKLQKDITMINRIISAPPWYIRIYNFLKQSPNKLLIKVGATIISTPDFNWKLQYLSHLELVKICCFYSKEKYIIKFIYIHI
ncbi:hypothetical protein MDAP_001517 [Mitosporidium daphniae]